MRLKNVNQLLLRFEADAVKLPREVIEEVYPLLVELILHAVTNQRSEKGGRDDRQDQGDAPRS